MIRLQGSAMRRTILLAVSWLIVIVPVTGAVLGFERLLREGRVVLLELAPLDPRSLMQGDYMALRFAIEGEIAQAIQAREEQGKFRPRTVWIAVDAEGRGRLLDVREELPTEPDVLGLRLPTRDARIGPGAFFFQEGRAEVFEAARWGEFRVAASGKALLTHLRDAELQRLGANHAVSVPVEE